MGLAGEVTSGLTGDAGIIAGVGGDVGVAAAIGQALVSIAEALAALVGF
jgi:hypothetical protein